MSKVFVGGSRRISSIPAAAVPLLEALLAEGDMILVGDADGADHRLQVFFAERGYDRVRVYCSGSRCRNNVGGWTVEHVPASGRPGSFSFYAAKDRRMADEASRAIMLWDGASMGTLMNVERMVSLGRPVDLVAGDEAPTAIGTRHDFDVVVEAVDEDARSDFERKRRAEEGERSARSRPARLF